jgi:UDP-N-acetylmuramoyl-tripeptide--D-alanyl-D-alanine ligase
VRAGDVTLDPDARAAFTLSWRGEDARVELAVTGEHMVPNALAAAAAGLALGGSVAECAAALKGAAVSPWRMDVRDRGDGVRIVNDAYNANPTSMAAALKAARWMARDRRCVAVLGEMAELGDAAVEEHDRVGEQVARLGIEELVTIGELGRVVARAATREGVEPGHVRECASAGEALTALRDLVRPGDVVLIKASRAVGLDRLASSLLSGQEGAA